MLQAIHSFPSHTLLPATTTKHKPQSQAQIWHGRTAFELRSAVHQKVPCKVADTATVTPSECFLRAHQWAIMMKLSMASQMSLNLAITHLGILKKVVVRDFAVALAIMTSLLGTSGVLISLCEDELIAEGFSLLASRLWTTEHGLFPTSTSSRVSSSSYPW